MNDSAAVVLAAFDAVQRRNRDELFDLYNDDVVFCDAASVPYGGTFRGKSGFATRWSATGAHVARHLGAAATHRTNAGWIRGWWLRPTPR